MQQPDAQKQYREEFVAEVGRMPEAKPVYLIADQLHYDQLDTIGDRSEPRVTKNELAMFYQRRSAVLQHKKHKLL